LNLKEIDTAQQSFPIVNKEVPYLIRSDRAISVHNRETENIFEPILNQITKQIVSTFLDEIQVTSLTTIQTIKNWNWEESKGDYIIISGAVMGTLLVLILVFVLVCKKGLLRNCFKRNPTEEIEIQRRQQNYCLNRLAMKK
jgi:predicted PurR-regulated permease PerM